MIVCKLFNVYVLPFGIINDDDDDDYQRSSGELVGGVCVEAVLEPQEQVNNVIEDVNGQHKQPRQVIQQLGVQSLILSFNPS